MMPAESEDTRVKEDMEAKTSLVEVTAASINVIPWSRLHTTRKISRGTEAEVVEAELKPEGRIVAIRKKFFRDEDEEDYDKPFCAEVRLMARLQHPNIVSFHGVAAHPYAIEHNSFAGHRDMVLDYMPNGNLQDVLAEDKDFVLLRWRSRVLLAHQIAEAMEYIHSVGIIHFDIKPTNILLDLSDSRQPVCKICDFGLATEKRDDMSSMHECGTIGYMAPEVAFCETITEKADVYSFGVLMYVLLTGDVEPKPSVASFEYVDELFLQNLRHHESVPDWCYHQWRELMKDCLAIEGSMRPAFSEVAARLGHILTPLPLPALKRKEFCQAADSRKLAIRCTRPALETLDFNIPFHCNVDLELRL